MEYNLRVQIALVVVMSNLYSPTNVKILLLKDRRLPTIELSEQSISDTLNQLIKKYLNVHPSWVKLIQGSVIDRVVDSKGIILTWGCMIPEEIPVDDDLTLVKLVDLVKDESFDCQQLEAIKYVSNRM